MRRRTMSTMLLQLLFITFGTLTQGEEGWREVGRDPCRDHAVLDDYRRSPLYQPETPRDVLCDRELVKGWYRFTFQNRSAEMPTRCASVNYCGTQAPIWIQLDNDQQMPKEHGKEIEATACVSWMSVDSEEEQQHRHVEDETTSSLHDTDCCAMKYPVTVRACSGYLVYKLIPTEACNMAYCAQPASLKDETFEFESAPAVRPVVVDNQRHSTNHHDRESVYLNCSLQINLEKINPKIQFRFHWLKKTQRRGHHQTVRTALVNQAVHFDLLARNQIAAGDKVICQVEAVIADDVTLPGGRPSTRVISSTASAPFTAGIVIDPTADIVVAYKNSSHVNITLSSTMPFVCAPHLSPKDCHLSVQIVQPAIDDETIGGEHTSRRQQLLAIAPCSLSLYGGPTVMTQSFFVVPIADFVRVRENVTQLQLVVTSYGDAWWHGFQLPNITVQVKDVPPVQCYAFTQGHVIGVSDSLDRVTQPGRHLLYANPLQSFEVWVEYQSCSGRKDSLCICSVEVRSFGVQSSGETFKLERCHRVQQQQHHSKRIPASNNKPEKNLPQMSLVGLNSKRSHFRVLESRQGKMISVVLEHGARIRVRTEHWGMSVSLVDAGQESDDLIDSIGGLCNPDNNLEAVKLKKKRATAAALNDARHLPDEFCTCAPSQDAFLSTVQVHNLPKCDPELEECPSSCQEPLKTVEWTTFFNYLDITDQVRLDVGDVDSPYVNSIDLPQRDSASVEDDPYSDFFPSFKWDESLSISSGTNLGRDIYWTTAHHHGRRRRDVSKMFHVTSEPEDVSLYCSNLLVNSTVALECGQYLVGSFILKAINICIDDVTRNEELSWAQESLGLLEDQCEVEASYQRTSDWSRDLLGHQAVSPAIVEALNCPNRCSFRGVCLSFGCVCQPGFSGSDCSLMDDNPPRIEKIKSGDGLCDVLTSECTKIEILGTGFIDSSLLTCQVHPGKYDGYNWHRGGIGNSLMDRSLPTSAEFVSQEKIICHLLHPKRLLDDISEELHLEIKVSNDGQRFSETDKLTIYHSGCRSCPKTKDGWPLCSDRDDVCYLDNTCYPNGKINPRNNCEKCDSDRPLSWSFNSANAQPFVIGSLKTSVYDGQLLEYVITVIDDDQVKFKLMDESDAKLSLDGVFRWTAVSNALTSNNEAFSIQVYDECHPPVDMKLQVEVLPCPCLNGGKCKNEAMNDAASSLTSNKIHDEKRLHYRCECRPGFEGSDCSSRIDFCDPNPCKNGLCLNGDDGFVCKCFNGHQGALCDKVIEEVVEMKNLTNPAASSVEESGCRCLNGGTCLEAGLRCSCPDGFTGKQCQWPAGHHLQQSAVTCSPGYCHNGGHCSRRGACICKKGWTGNQCQTAVCEPACLNGGWCSSPGKCTCPVEYRGSRCQKPVCKPKCRNGGKCIGPNLCQCLAGFTGYQCQTKTSTSTITNSLPTATAKTTTKKRKTKKKSKTHKLT